jgi:hypothetical protein
MYTSTVAVVQDVRIAKGYPSPSSIHASTIAFATWSVAWKTFEKKLVPTGKQICENNLSPVDKVENVEVDESQIKDYLPVIFSKLSWLDREELIKRFMSIEFNQFLSYYKDSRDINLDSKNRGDDRSRGDRGGRSERGSRDERGSREQREPWKKKEYGSRDDGGKVEGAEQEKGAMGKKKGVWGGKGPRGDRDETKSGKTGGMTESMVTDQNQ